MSKRSEMEAASTESPRAISTRPKSTRATVSKKTMHEPMDAAYTQTAFAFSVGTIVYSTDLLDEGCSAEHTFFLVIRRTDSNVWLVPVAKTDREGSADKRYEYVREIRPVLLEGEPLMLPNAPHGEAIPFRVSVGQSHQVKRPFLYRHRGRFVAFPYSPRMTLLDSRLY